MPAVKKPVAPDVRVTEAEVQLFATCKTQLKTLLAEFSVLSKSKPDSPLNKFKVKSVNVYLEHSNSLLQSDAPIPDFGSFSDDDLPTNSDVVMVLSQYLASLESWRSSKAIYSKEGYWYWNTRDGSAIRTEVPTRPYTTALKSNAR